MAQGAAATPEELYHLVHRLGKVFRAADAASGLPSAQLSALITVVMHGPVTIGSLAGFELVTPQSVSRVVDDLDSQSLTRRSLDPRDRRRTLVAATAKGRRMALVARQSKIDHLAGYLATLDPAEQRLVRRAVALLTPILDS